MSSVYPAGEDVVQQTTRRRSDKVACKVVLCLRRQFASAGGGDRDAELARGRWMEDLAERGHVYRRERIAITSEWISTG
jgi:hypothetical protein